MVCRRYSVLAHHYGTIDVVAGMRWIRPTDVGYKFNVWVSEALTLTSNGEMVSPKSPQGSLGVYALSPS